MKPSTLFLFLPRSLRLAAKELAYDRRTSLSALVRTLLYEAIATNLKAARVLRAAEAEDRRSE